MNIKRPNPNFYLRIELYVGGGTGNGTWHPTHSLRANLGEEQGLHPPPVSPTLHPRTPGILSSIEDIFRVVEGDDDGGFCVRRQGGNYASGPFCDSHFRFCNVWTILGVLATQNTRIVFTEAERP